MNITTLARDVALAELGVPVRALRYVSGGFRAAQPRGAIAYDDGGNTPLLLGAVALLALPEMAALDLALWHAPAWRIASDAVHVYGALWLLGIAQALRTLPHVIDGRTATFRSLFLREIEVPLEAIAAIEIVPATRRRKRGQLRFGFGFRERALRVVLHEPIAVRHWLGAPRFVTTFLVGADNLARLANALRR